VLLSRSSAELAFTQKAGVRMTISCV
jgi:hypothetical protein